MHAGVIAEAHERKKLERLCRYITRPAIAEHRLSLTAQGGVGALPPQPPYRDGTTHMVHDPLDFIVRPPKGSSCITAIAIIGLKDPYGARSVSSGIRSAPVAQNYSLGTNRASGCSRTATAEQLVSIG